MYKRQLLCNAGQTCYKKQGVEVKAHGQEIPDHESEESAATPEEWRYDPDDDLDDWRFPDELPELCIRDRRMTMRCRLL